MSYGLTITGTTGNDLLTAGKWNDTLYGDIGDDTLVGGKGADSMIGGDGNDTYYVDNPYDIVVQTSSDISQIDTIIASVSYSLPNNAENLILTGKSNIYAIGNTLDNLITGNSGKNYLAGETGNDTIYGGSSNDTLYGGAGNDSLLGGSGNDLYIFHPNDGNDTINDSGGANTILFTSGITPDDVSFDVNGYDLLITTDNQTIDAVNFYYGKQYKGSSIRFIDGITIYKDSYYDMFVVDTETQGQQYDYTAIASSLTKNEIIASGAGDSAIDGGSGNDLIFGEAGNDTLYGGTGNDILIGGTGDDILEGGSGNDICVITANSGNDTITDLSGKNTVIFDDLCLSDLSLTRTSDTILGTTGYDLVIEDTILHLLSKNSTVFRFAEGISVDSRKYTHFFTDTICSSKSDAVYITGATDTINGGSGNDLIIYNNSSGATISGGSGNDIISGGSGNDTLYGNSGNDLYTFNIGDNHDTVADSSGTDTIYLGNATDLAKTAIYRDNAGNVYIDYGNAADQDVITINAGSKIEKIRFYDGSYLTSNDINSILQTLTSYATGHGLTITGVTDVKNSAELMPLIISRWHLSVFHNAASG